MYNLNGKVVYGTESSADTFIRGWTPNMARIYDLDVVTGRAINDSDLNTASPVVVIGWDIRENLLGATDPLGKDHPCGRQRVHASSAWARKRARRWGRAATIG